MKGDFTRSTFNARKHYTRVLMQQGRVQLDADWNEQLDITGHRLTVETIDIIGRCGAPQHEPGFHVVADVKSLTPDEQALPGNQSPPVIKATDLLISAGRFYAGGWLCENESIIAYSGQPDLPNPPAAKAGTYVAYLDVWMRHITALEDPSIREVALGGPDTATRAKTVWQVKLLGVDPGNAPATCATKFKEWDALVTAPTGTLAAQAAVAPPSDKPCVVPPGAGYRRLENQLYRVEVHDGGALGTATFKWSRDNGSIVTAWTAQDVNALTVASVGKDSTHSFAAGEWVELTDDSRELNGTTGTIVRLVKVEGNVLTIDPTTATGTTDRAQFPANPKIRRWDMPNGLVKPTDGSFMDLEDGVQVSFGSGTYRTGDFWMIPARTATGAVEWPVDAASKPLAQLPMGIAHRYCKLGVLAFDGKQWKALDDCRNLFPPLGELTDFFYVGGDGQEGTPDPTQSNGLAPLPQPLEVGVINGQEPVAGASVRFTILLGSGTVQNATPSVTVQTGANGIASCAWSLDGTTQSQRVEAVLLDDGGNPICVPIHFNASLSAGSVAAMHVLETNWQNDDLFNILAPEGLRIRLSAEPVAQSVSAETVIVTAEIPYTQSTAITAMQEIILPGDVSIDPTDKRVIVWKLPVNAAGGFNTGALMTDVRFSTLAPARAVRIRVRLLGRDIWTVAAGGGLTDKTSLLYLDGQAFGRPAVRTDGTPRTALIFPSGAGARGSDFASWLYFGAARPAISLTLDQATVAAGQADGGTITLGTAPAAGTVLAVALASSVPTVAIVPPTVNVPGGQTSAHFDFKTALPALTNVPSASISVTITAKLPTGETATATLTVTKPG